MVTIRVGVAQCRGAQAGFRAGRSTIDQISVVRQLSEKFREMDRTLCNNFVDFKQAFDSVWQKGYGKF